MVVQRDRLSNHPDCPECPCRPRSSRPTPLPRLRAAISPDAPRGCRSQGAPKSLHGPAQAPPPRPPPTTSLSEAASLSLPLPTSSPRQDWGAGRGVGLGFVMPPPSRASPRSRLQFPAFLRSLFTDQITFPLATKAASTRVS